MPESRQILPNTYFDPKCPDTKEISGKSQAEEATIENLGLGLVTFWASSFSTGLRYVYV